MNYISEVMWMSPGIQSRGRSSLIESVTRKKSGTTTLSGWFVNKNAEKLRRRKTKTCNHI